MDHEMDQQWDKRANGPLSASAKPLADLDPEEFTPAIDGDAPKWNGLKGLLVAQIFGQFNDQAWKQIVILLAMATVASEAAKQERTAIVTMMLLIPLTIISLPAGVLADRVSKRSVIIAMKVFELILMLAGAAALYMQPHGGWVSIAVLGLIGVQTAFFVPAKYGILPEILPHERLSAGNGLLEMTSNLAMLAGIVGGGIILYEVGTQTWLGGGILAILSAFGLWASLSIPPVAAGAGRWRSRNHGPPGLGINHVPIGCCAWP